ncbi:MAG: hypothetical protein HKO66_04360 [Saprospiraceae bacterium]|nr:hypothetical protein [Bacteroidia bacterium]NNE16549.1 hypothetical protein [Saprospiraceae bacterium]NNL91444.1 hypothetical protein [Saprospiraceae bacterium]
MNNFKKLQEEQEEQYKDNLLGIKSSIEGNLGVIGIFTGLIETYITKLIQCMINLSGGSSDKLDK